MLRDLGGHPPYGCSQDGTLLTLSEMMRSTNVLTHANP